jgi:hypothetical protein
MTASKTTATIAKINNIFGVTRVMEETTKVVTLPSVVVVVTAVVVDDVG